MARPFEAAFFGTIEDISELLLTQPALAPDDLFRLLDQKRDDDRNAWALMLADYPDVDDQDTAIWHQGCEWGYDVVVSLLRDHLSA